MFEWQFIIVPNCFFIGLHFICIYLYRFIDIQLCFYIRFFESLLNLLQGLLINNMQCFISILTFGCSFHRKQTNMWHLCLQLELTLSVFHLYIQNRESIFKLIKVKMKLINQAFNQLVIFKVTASTGRLCNAFNNFHEFSITAQCYFFFLYILREFLSS